jgi:hypothetical protein
MGIRKQKEQAMKVFVSISAVLMVVFGFACTGINGGPVWQPSDQDLIRGVMNDLGGQRGSESSGSSAQELGLEAEDDESGASRSFGSGSVVLPDGTILTEERLVDSGLVTITKTFVYEGEETRKEIIIHPVVPVAGDPLWLEGSYSMDAQRETWIKGVQFFQSDLELVWILDENDQAVLTEVTAIRYDLLHPERVEVLEIDVVEDGLENRTLTQYHIEEDETWTKIREVAVRKYQIGGKWFTDYVLEDGVRITVYFHNYERIREIYRPDGSLAKRVEVQFLGALRERAEVTYFDEMGREVYSHVLEYEFQDEPDGFTVIQYNSGGVTRTLMIQVMEDHYLVDLDGRLYKVSFGDKGMVVEDL